jgi:hypothetical protein
MGWNDNNGINGKAQEGQGQGMRRGRLVKNETRKGRKTDQKSTNNPAHLSPLLADTRESR